MKSRLFPAILFIFFAQFFVFSFPFMAFNDRPEYCVCEVECRHLSSACVFIVD
ncbi:hypothetical protein Hanom_Chr16g01504951 [Helianthus anomalus]